MRIGLASVVMLIAVIGATLPCEAQTGGAPSTTGNGSIGGFGRGGVMNQDAFNKMSDYANQAQRLTKDDKAKGKTIDDLMKEDKAAAMAVAGALPLSCQVDKAILAAQGPETIDGKTVQTKTYEAICANGMGYFLTAREAAAGSGISCFAADAARATDIAAGRKPGPACGLPELADIKSMATAVMTRAGTPCAVRDYRWLGPNAAAHVEFNEIACSDNTGYILTVALPGSTAPARIMSCRDSNARGLPCKLSDNGGAPLTAQTFRNALQQRSIACDAGDKDIQLHGQETNLKRFVVEFKCSQHTQGLVAYIPLNGVKSPFEVVDCAGAAKRGVKCTLNAVKP